MANRHMYARLGQLISFKLYERLSTVQNLPAPGEKSFVLRMVQEPYIHGGGWSFLFDVDLPKNEGSLSFILAQSGSAFNPEKVTLELPEMNFVDDLDEKFPQAHADEYWTIFDSTIEQIELRGFKHASDGDFCVYENYLPSTCVNVAVLNPQVLTREIAAACQALLANRAFPFSIAFTLDFDFANYEGRDECVIVRPDRIAEDWNISRLRSEFGSRFQW